MIRKANLYDIKKVVKIYENILNECEKSEKDIGWVRGVYPTEKTAEAAYERKDLFVLEKDGLILAAGVINKIQVPEYMNAKWEWKNAKNEEIMVLHTLVVEPSATGKGLGTSFVEFYEEYARANKCPYLRMDTNAKNEGARKLYAHLGYKEADIVPANFNGIPGVDLVCLEKKIET